MRIENTQTIYATLGKVGASKHIVLEPVSVQRRVWDASTEFLGLDWAFS
jgi:hypothetical protein